MATEQERLLSAADAEKVLGIPSATVRSWWRRQQFTGLWDYGVDKRGHPLFRESDLRGLRDKNGAKPRRRDRELTNGRSDATLSADGRGAPFCGLRSRSVDQNAEAPPSGNYSQ